MKTWKNNFNKKDRARDCHKKIFHFSMKHQNLQNILKKICPFKCFADQPVICKVKMNKLIFHSQHAIIIVIKVELIDLEYLKEI